MNKSEVMAAYLEATETFGISDKDLWLGGTAAMVLYDIWPDADDIDASTSNKHLWRLLISRDIPSHTYVDGSGKEQRVFDLTKDFTLHYMPRQPDMLVSIGHVQVDTPAALLAFYTTIRRPDGSVKVAADQEKILTLKKALSAGGAL